MLPWPQKVFETPTWSCKMSQFAPNNLQVPPGFEYILEGLTREVLREQPLDIITFAADYFRKQLNLRNSKSWLAMV